MEEKQIRTLAEWQEIYLGIQALMQEQIPIKEGYWLARNADRIETAIKHLDKLRLKMLEELADKDEEGRPIIRDQQFKLSGESLVAFQEAWNDVIGQIETIELRLISLAKIGEKLETIKPAILKAVMPILEKEDETK